MAQPSMPKSPVTRPPVSDPPPEKFPISEEISQQNSARHPGSTEMVSLLVQDTIRIPLSIKEEISESVQLQRRSVKDARSEFERARAALEGFYKDRDSMKGVISPAAMETQASHLKKQYAIALAENVIAVKATEISISKPIKGFFSIGPSYALADLNEAYISPIDSTLQLQSQSQFAMFLSTGIAVPFAKGKGVIFDKPKGEGISTSEFEFEPSRLALIANINLAQFSTATFNQKVTGGLGIGYLVGENLYLAMTFDVNLSRQLKDYYKNNYFTKQIKFGTTPDSPVLATLDESNSQYFYDMYYLSLSIKFVYVFAGQSEK